MPRYNIGNWQRRRAIGRRTAAAMANLNRAVKSYRPKKSRIFRFKPKWNDTSPFPRKKLCTLKYCEDLTLTTTVGGLSGQYSFRSNSIFDPDFTGAGHQPLFHDELATVYQKYKVLGCAYRITFMDSTYNWHVGTFMTGDTSYNPTTVSFDVTQEKRGMYSKMMALREGKRIMKGYIANSKLMGVSKYEYNGEDNYGASFGANPTNVGFLTLLAQTIDQQASVACQVNVQLKYYVEVYDPKVTSQS